MSEPVMGKIENDHVLPYSFSIKQIFSDAWTHVSGFKTTLWIALVIYIGIEILLVCGGNIVIYLITGSFDQADPIVKTYSNFLQPIIALITFPMAIGLYYLGVRRAGHFPIHVRMVLTPYRSYGRLLVSMLLIYFIFFVLFVLGMILIALSYILQAKAFLSLSVYVIGILLVLSGIYTLFSLFFSPLLIVDKQISVIRSLKLSFRGFKQHGLKILFSYVLMSIIIGISAIPLGIGLIWSIPMAVSLFGVIYRTVFGVQSTSVIENA